MKQIIVLGLLLGLAGCVDTKPVVFNPDDFINPNHVVVNKAPVPLPLVKVNATYGCGNNPAVVKAYQHYVKTGVAQSVQSDNVRTFAYDAYSHPIVECSPMHLCVIQLERGEIINDVNLGDSKFWFYGSSLIGTPLNGSYQVVVQPKRFGIATDMVLTTNKRIYNIGLVSKPGAVTHVANFYYPQETLTHALGKQTLLASSASKVVSTHFDIHHIHFNYTIKGDYPVWRPIRVFDDGAKTFIQMPAATEQTTLPVLYIKKSSGLALVNYRFKAPYYIVDGLFHQAYLVTGRGSSQVRVSISQQST